MPSPRKRCAAAQDGRDEKTSLAEYAVNVVGQEYVREGRETCPLFFLRYV